MKILGYILVIFAAANFASSFADETKLKLRKVKNNNAGSENISIKINPEMFILKDLKELKNQYKATEAFAKETDKLTKPRKKIKFRSAEASEANYIYSQYADSVVFIGNSKTII